MEMVAVLDESGAVIGSAPRSAVRAGNLRHAAAAVVVTDGAGYVYVHRRTETKDVYPGRWDCWVGGVLTAGETALAGARRELAEELGVAGVTLTPLGSHWYRDADTHYLAHTYTALWRGAVVHQASEVAEGDWMAFRELLQRLWDPSWPFVPDGRELLRLSTDVLLGNSFVGGG